MQVLEKESPPGAVSSFDNVGQEILFFWSKLPDRYVFALLLGVWCALFYLFGWSSAIAGRSDSLLDWMWAKWTDPANDASHGKLIPWVVLGLLWLRRKRLVESVAG